MKLARDAEEDFFVRKDSGGESVVLSLSSQEAQVPLKIPEQEVPLNVIEQEEPMLIEEREETKEDYGPYDGQFTLFDR